MSDAEAAKILEQHNLWRRGSDDVQMVAPYLLGQAIDVAIAYLKSQEQSKQ